jgi:hypothetical protein
LDTAWQLQLPIVLKWLVANSLKCPTSETVLKSKYIDLSFLSPTTVIVESLSSKWLPVMTVNR